MCGRTIPSPPRSVLCCVCGRLVEPNNCPLTPLPRTQVEVIIWDGFCHAEFLLAPCLHRSFVRAIAKQERALGLAASAP